MANPLIAQGSLNRILGSVIFNSNPSFNVTSPFLSREGIRLALQGQSTVYLPTMTGAVRSQAPYMMVECTINLLKSQALANQFKDQMEVDSFLGDMTVRPDSTTLNPYAIVNVSIQNVRELDFSGENAVYSIVMGGYYQVNGNLFA